MADGGWEFLTHTKNQWGYQLGHILNYNPLSNPFPLDINYISMLPWNPGVVHICSFFLTHSKGYFSGSVLMILVFLAPSGSDIFNAKSCVKTLPELGLQSYSLLVTLWLWLTWPIYRWFTVIFHGYARHNQMVLHFTPIHGHSSSIAVGSNYFNPNFPGESPHFLVVSKIILVGGLEHFYFSIYWE